MRPRLVCLLATLLPLGSAAAEEKAAPNTVEVHFIDGSAVKMILLHDRLEVATRYGKLSVPVRELHRIDLGLRYPEGVQQKIQDAIVNLNHPDFKKREAAQAELVRFRELAYPLVVQALKLDNPETAKRARAIVEELRTRLSEEALNAKPHDSIQTSDFPINGRIEVATLKARNPLFGEVTLKLIDVRSIRFPDAASDAAK